eukprot:gene13494-13607_t
MLNQPLDDPEFVALLAASVRIGVDPTKTQAAGGNTSLKRAGLLWIKASGMWLAHAMEKPIFVPVEIAPLLDAVTMDHPNAERAEVFIPEQASNVSLRPSIETTVHALMPQAVVLHVHCVETIAWASLQNAEDATAPHLNGLDWAFVPYARPGLPLAKAIRAARRATTNVLILGNHGLVVAAATVAEAEALLAKVISRLRRPVRSSPPGNIARLQQVSAGTDWRPALYGATHNIATNALNLALATAGSLYPDHVIFLGHALPVLKAGQRPDDVHGVAVIVPDAGVLIRKTASVSVDEMLRCLALVVSRIDTPNTVKYLTLAEEGDLTNWEAEKYRQKLAAITQ